MDDCKEVSNESLSGQSETGGPQEASVIKNSDGNAGQWQIVNNVLVAKSALLSPTAVSEYSEAEVCGEVVVGHDLTFTGQYGEVVVVDDLNAHNEFSADLQLSCGESQETSIESCIPEVMAEETVTSSHTQDEAASRLQQRNDEEIVISQNIIKVQSSLKTSSHSSHVSDKSSSLQTGGGRESLSKKERERLIKRELRKDPQFRAKERVKLRSRMQDLRSDPAYRERERQKDRERRRLSRQTNAELRMRERERDRNHKRQLKKRSNGGQLVAEDGEVIFPVGVLVEEEEATGQLDALQMYSATQHDISAP